MSETELARTNNDLVYLEQLPVIVDRLQEVRAGVEAMVADVDSMFCNAGTLRNVKNRRSELKKIYSQLESQRKAVKAAILAPYEQFEATYRECVGDLFERADAVLKEKIDAVESAMKADLRERLVAYFEECRSVEGIDWLEFDQLNLKYGVTEAKQKIPKALFQSISEQVTQVRKDVDAINSMGNSEEIMLEYRRTLSVNEAVGIVQCRKAELEREQQAKAEWSARKAAEEEHIRELRAAPVREEQILSLRFTVRGTREKLRALKKFLDDNGYDYQ